MFYGSSSWTEFTSSPSCISVTRPPSFNDLTPLCFLFEAIQTRSFLVVFLQQICQDAPACPLSSEPLYPWIHRCEPHSGSHLFPEPHIHQNSIRNLPFLRSPFRKQELTYLIINFSVANLPLSSSRAVLLWTFIRTFIRTCKINLLKLSQLSMSDSACVLKGLLTTWHLHVAIRTFANITNY